MGIKIDIKPKDLKTLLNLLQLYLPNTRVCAFGSRVKFTARPNSDLDLVAFASDNQKVNIAIVKEKLVESDLPFRVDLHNWNEIPDSFKKNIEADYVVVQEEKKMEITEGWKRYKLGEICEDISYGYTESASKEVIGPKFVRITDIQYDFIDWDKVPYCTITDENYQKFKLIYGDLVIARTGASTGTTAIFKDEKIDAVFASYLIRYKIKKSVANPFYIGHLLKSSLWKSYVASIIGGSAQPGANAKQFADFEFILPDLSTQTKIAQILTSLDEKIELNLQMNQTLEAMAQAIFKEWFVDFNFPKSSESGFAGLKDDRIKKENKKEILKSYNPTNPDSDNLPHGWRWGKLGELTDVKTGKGLIRKGFNALGKYPIIGANGELGRTDNYLLDSKLLLTGRVGTLGAVKISYGKKWYSDNVLIMEPHRFFYYCYFVLKRIDMSSLNRGSTQPLITQTDLKNYLILIPRDDVLSIFEETINDIFEKIFFNDIQIQTLTQTRDTLLPKLMSGRIEVK